MERIVDSYFMDKQRREYSVTLTFNQRTFIKVIIDPHYEEKHSDINDSLILELVKLLDGTEAEAEDETNGFKYFAREMFWRSKKYRIILTYCEEDFLGVINVFRVKERKL